MTETKRILIFKFLIVAVSSRRVEKAPTIDKIHIIKKVINNKISIRAINSVVAKAIKQPKAVMGMSKICAIPDITFFTGRKSTDITEKPINGKAKVIKINATILVE